MLPQSSRNFFSVICSAEDQKCLRYTHRPYLRSSDGLSSDRHDCCRCCCSENAWQLTYVLLILCCVSCTCQRCGCNTSNIATDFLDSCLAFSQLVEQRSETTCLSPVQSCVAASMVQLYLNVGVHILFPELFRHFLVAFFLYGPAVSRCSDGKPSNRETDCSKSIMSGVGHADIDNHRTFDPNE